MTPAVPHVCEELYVGEEDGIASLAVYDADAKKYINKDVEAIEGITQELLRVISYQKDKRGLATITTVKLVQAKTQRFKLFDRIKELLSQTNEFKVILPALLKDYDDKQFITKFVPKTLGSGLQAYLPKEEEKVYLDSIKDFIASEFGCNVELLDADTLDVNIQCLPGSPGAIIE